jgi:hypothetical protein
MHLALRKIIEISSIFSPSERTINPTFGVETARARQVRELKSLNIAPWYALEHAPAVNDLIFSSSFRY